MGRRSSNASNAPQATQRRLGGSPGGPENRQGTSPGPKKCFRRRRRKRFSSMFCASAVLGRSPDRLFEGPTLENRAPTTAGARFWQNHRLPKNTKKVVSGESFLAQKMQKNDAGASKIAKSVQKSAFWTLVGESLSLPLGCAVTSLSP